MNYDLLSVAADAKTVKGEKRGWLTGVLYLAPADEAGTGVNLCPAASDECKRACLYGAGMAQVFSNIKRSRIEKTKQYIADPAAFIDRLVKDIAQLEREAAAKWMRPCVRVNGTSDQPKMARELARRFPHVQFYDYTKLARPWERTGPNYHLTFSHSGTNIPACMAALKRGINVAVVFKGQVPIGGTWNGYKVINGDESDLRFLDPTPVIVGLRAKGDARKMEAGGFVQVATKVAAL